MQFTISRAGIHSFNLSVMKRVKTWWLLFIEGTILVAAGIFSWITPLNAYIKLVKYSGFFLLINGFLLIMTNSLRTQNEKEKNWIRAETILDLFFGALLLISPLLAFFIFPILIGHWILGLGTLKIVAALSLRKHVRGWAFIFITGVISIIFGVLIAYVPYTKGNEINQLIGAFGVLMGSLTMFDSFRFRKKEDTLDLLL
jgi:uncharacterized membrane protein HdeD (DUF308 family)